MLFQSLRREVAQDPKRKQVRLLSLTSMHTSLSDHICFSPRALSDCSTPASDSVRSIRRYRSSVSMYSRGCAATDSLLNVVVYWATSGGITTTTKQATTSHPGLRTTEQLFAGYYYYCIKMDRESEPALRFYSSSPKLQRLFHQDYDDTTAPPYTPTSFTSSTPCTSYASSSTAQFATNKKHPYGEDASPVSPASGLTSVPNYEEYDASGIPFSPVTASFPDLSNGNLGRSHFFEYSQPIIIKNCFTVCCERCAIERVEWNSSASLSTPSSSPKYAHHSTCDQPNGSTYFCRCAFTYELLELRLCS